LTNHTRAVDAPSLDSDILASDQVKVLGRVMQRVQQNVRLLIAAVDAALAARPLEAAA